MRQRTASAKAASPARASAQAMIRSSKSSSSPAGPLGLVADEDIGHLVGADAAAPLGPPGLGLVVLGGDEARLGPPDLAVEGAHPARVAGDDIGQEAAAIGQQLGLGASPLGPVLAEEPQRGVVEGARLDARHPERPQAGAQLLGRLAAERGHQGPVGLDGPVPHPAGHPQGEHPGLAGAGAGHDAEQRILGLDGGALGQREAAGAGKLLPGLTLERDRHVLTVPNGCAWGSGRWSLR